jgi:2-oxoglutarate dehydrogenase E1 component
MMSLNKQASMKSWNESSYLDGANAAYLEDLYEEYQRDPSAFNGELADLLKQLSDGPAEAEHSKIREQFKALADAPRAQQVAATPEALKHAKNQAGVSSLINAYRSYGHTQATLDPLDLDVRPKMKRLNLDYHGLSGCESLEFNTDSFYGLSGSHKLSEIQASLHRTYCQNFTAEYLYVSDTSEFEWLAKRIEENQGKASFSNENKKQILSKLTAAEGLEKYLGRRYVGQKRFSLEGGDSLIPLLDYIISDSPSHNVEEAMIGMAHRGRLNVLVNILGKSPTELFDEFEGKHQDTTHMGDVKYHMGFSSNLNLGDNKLFHLSLAFNPSHLEIVDPVVQGAVRAKQRRRKDKERKTVLPILIHGDAAFCGQGVVMETFAMSQARGFKTGGTIHVVINNQIGFTTDHPILSTAQHYCTDIAKMVQAPVLHVNGDDPEAVVFAAQIALDYRIKFKKDIVIDLVCYRLHGHNESDEPSATQPLMYKTIKAHATPRAIYAEKIIQEGVLSSQEAKDLLHGYQDALDQGEPVSQATNDLTGYQYAANWQPYLQTHWRDSFKTDYSVEKLKAYGEILFRAPEGFALQPQVKKVMNDRLKAIETGEGVDWGTAENLAYASLLDQGFPMRLCGQDSCRGTFAHRHAVFHDQANGDTYTPLQHINEKQSPIIIINSILSEEGVLGFEYGYASAEPDNLVVWEAQFGDFVNGAQVVIDQFIAAGEQKWGRMCGLVMLLPHGYEGMGAEHSSARLERFLQLCAQDNMQICIPSTPAQIYHLIRRQMLRSYRKPLIVMTPKSMLRHKLVVSSLDDLANGSYQLVIPEIDTLQSKKVTKVLLCSGKVYYDLLIKRRDQNIENIALIRIEQLYPFPDVEVKQILADYPQAKEVIWCQEEPMNQGAWYSIRHRIEECITAKQTLRYVGRGFASAPAVGVAALHVKEQTDLVNDALGIKQ